MINALQRFIFLSLLLVTMGASAQQKPTIPINDMVEKLQGFFSVYPMEKVHVHFDKPYYAVGDTLWFKTYLKHNLVEYDPSKIVYLEVLNSRDSLVQTLRVKLEGGVGKGQLVLDPEYWKQDNYRFRAYTKWMMNFDNAYFFNRAITIGDAINKKLGATLQFSPDGNRTKATLQLRDIRGELMGRKKLTWQATDGWDPFDKGKAETDDMGRVSINLSNKHQDLMKMGQLIVNVDNDGDAVVGTYSLSNAVWDADVQFFPEGGDLIAGLAKNVAFKAVSNLNRGERIKGKVIDSKKKEVVSFEDLGLGMGSFLFVPESGNTYSAVVTFANGEERTYELPAVVDDAVNLVGLKQDATNLQVGIVTSDLNFEKLKDQPFYIIGQSNGHLVYAAQAGLKNASILVKVPKENLPGGIVQFTLFRADGTPISERLVYCEPSEMDTINVVAKTDKSSYSAKEKVALNIGFDNQLDSNSVSYSVAVVDASKVPLDEDNDLTILSNLLLTSDLKGFVEKPNYYFNAKNENRKEALEALLMTQGFSKYEYKDFIAGKYPQVLFLPEQGISLSGTLRLNTGRPQPNGGLMLSIPAAAVRKDAYTDQNGKFVFENIEFPDSSKVTINARGNDNFRSLVINMDQTFFPDIDKNSSFKGGFMENIDQDLKSYLDNSRKEFRTSVLIDEVVVSRNVVPKQTSRDFSALTGLSMPEHRIEADRITGCNVLTMCLNTLLTGITYDSNTLKYYVTRNYNQGSRIPVQFFLNGMPIDEPSLNSIQPSEIEAIEIFLRDDLGTVRNTYQNDGTVSIITKKEQRSDQPRMTLAELEAMLPKTNVIDMYPLGFVRTKQFYVPKYDTPERRNVEDLRTTIYWNPDVKLTDSTATSTLEYYNADGNGKYRVVIEGMDDFGRVGRKVLNYEVK